MSTYHHLFGKYNPAGRVPVTYYNSIEDLPPFDDYDITKRTYKYFEGDVLYPFGYGLSYTSFRYSDLKIEDKGSTVDVTFTLRNVGRYDGDEVVQLYINDVVASVEPLHKALKGFKRVNLKVGESKEISFNLGFEELSLYNMQMQQVVEHSFKVVQPLRLLERISVIQNLKILLA